MAVTKFKQYNLDDIPEVVETPDFMLIISAAIVKSLKNKKLLTQRQEDICIDKLEELHK